jgi:hypothetical protein
MIIESKYKPSDMGNPFLAPGEISLPFPHLQLFWHNGKADAEPKGAYHFGGWYCGADKFIPDIENFNVDPAVVGFKGPDTWHNQKGGEYQSYHIRSVFVAPIAPRKYWFTDKEGRNKSTYSMLSFMAYANDKKVFVPLGPVVLSASSYSGGFLEDAITSFPTVTAEARKKVAPNVPSWQWYIPIGTFGAKRITKIVGTTKTSPIVPAQLYVPEGGWGESISHYFVPDEIVQQMMDTKKAAEEWLAWRPEKVQEPLPVAADDVFPEV